jgi:iron complex outermembrane receptor protein
MSPRTSLVIALLLIGSVRASASGTAQPDSQDLKRLSIEELMNVDVTLTSRRAEPIATTPAAVSVLTTDDIRRAGVTSLPAAVALIDGLHAARFNNGTWSITSRGFNAVTANKMLVMIDGRTVYSPLFSGVFWNAVDYTLEDIERIEVVRGPGATLWGANAVNGVINIVTRDSRRTTGTYIQAGAGNEDPVVVDARYGHASDAGAYRLYAKYSIRDDQRFSDGTSTADRVRRAQAGFRVDRGDTANGLMLKGDLFVSGNDFPDRADGSFVIGDLHGRWTRNLSPRSALQVQSYLNHETREIPLQLEHRLTTFDIDAQHALTTARHSLVWGGGARINHDRPTGTAVLTCDPASRTYSLVNTFVQDEVALVPGRAFLTAGLKVERNAFSGVEFQPGVRARVLLPRQQMLWGSRSRAVRRPTRFETDIMARTPAGLLVARGNPDFEPERLIATEAGYRVQPTASVSFDATLFVHRLDRLRSQEAPTSGPPIPIVVGNTQNGSATGVELSMSVQPAPWWRSHLSYTGQRVRVTRDPGSRDIGTANTEANDPAHQFALRSAFDLPAGLMLDARLRHVGALPHPVVPRYTELAARVAWQPQPRFEIALVGEDLLHDRHPEFNPVARGFQEFERSVRATVTLWIP